MTDRKRGDRRLYEQSWIDYMMDRSKYHLEMAGVNPELDNLLQGRPRKNYRHRTHEELLGDVNQLYDKLVALARERDDLRGKLSKATTALYWLNIKFWIVSCTVVAEAGVIAFLAKELFSRLH